MSTAVAGGALLATVPISANSPALGQPVTTTGQGSPGDNAFTIAGLRAGQYRAVSAPLTPRQKHLLATQRREVRTLANGEVASVDTSLLGRGLSSAATIGAVRLAWVPSPASGGYVVLRDGHVLGRLSAGAGTFTDATVDQGQSYDYILAPARVHPKSAQIPVWGMHVEVPSEMSTDTEISAGTRQAVQSAQAAAAAATTTLTWDAFIPQAKIDAPSTGCSYGSGYQFGGDNRSFDWTSSRYRTALNAVITWSTKAVSGYVSVGTTHVYKKSTGALVAQRTASTADMVSKKLGDSTGQVDIRMVNHASNPFCSFGAIDGAITFNIYQNGNWAIRSGTFRRMPNHEIYIWNGGNVTYLIKAPYQSVYCLIGPVACDSMDVTGYYGSYS